MVSMMLQRSEFLRGIVQGVGKGDKTIMVVSLLGVKLYEGVEMHDFVWLLKYAGSAAYLRCWLITLLFSVMANQIWYETLQLSLCTLLS